MSRKGRREHLVPELTPLIDVVFLLLIFFMVSSVFKKEELALLLNLPKAESGEGETDQKKEFITIELSSDSIAYESKKISLEDLPSEIQKLEKKILINLRVDGGVKYERLVSILDLLQKNKLENLSLITVRKEK